MNFDFIGLSSILFVTLIVYQIAKLNPSIKLILYVALVVRILFIFINNSIFVLPDGFGDTNRFELRAYEWSTGGFLSVLGNFPGFSSFFISWIIAILYSIFGQSVLMGQALSLLFGMGSVFLGWLLAKKLWERSVATKAAWFIALFPSLILYSCLILRETYICFFLLLALIGVVEWIRYKNLKSLFVTIIGFLGATLFHDAMIVGLVFFVIFIFIKNIKSLLIELLSLKINLKSLKIFSFIVIFISFIFLNEVSFPKIGSLTDLSTKVDRILDQINNVNKGTAKYPNWLVPDTGYEIIYIAPLRMIYFVFSPFPWDVKQLSHLIGVFDASLYMFLTYLIFLNRKRIFSDPSLKIILLLLLVYIFVFGIGVGKFGTGIRHRSKIVIMFIILAAPLLPKFIFSVKNNFKKKIK